MLVMNFTLPQRFQLVNNLSALDAGVRILPFGATFPLGAIFSAKVGGKLQVPGLFLAMFGAAIQVVGFALLSTLPSSTHIDPAIYGYEVLCGVGTGMTYQILYLMVPFTVDDRDKGKFSCTIHFLVVGCSPSLSKHISINMLCSCWYGNGESVSLDGKCFWACHHNVCLQRLYQAPYIRAGGLEFQPGFWPSAFRVTPS